MVKRERISPWPFVGMAGLACTFFLNVGVGLAGVAPWWGVLLLVLKWLVLLRVAIRWWTPRPRGTVVLAVIDLVLWIGIVSAGGLWWGWTA